MLRLILLSLSIVFAVNTFASKMIVSNENEIIIANKNAKSGDTIVLKNGNWNNIAIKLNCKGTKENPIVFIAETKGKVIINGNSKLLIGGDYIIVDGLYFTNGYSGVDAVIKFSINKNEIANNCRVTNTVINDFNNPKRLDENYWVALYGKNNRIDHCTFLNKKNLGVLLAVILEDDRSRANFHSIDHNHFGFRIPLASNGGEIIRVGVSEHCEFNSNTKIEDNFFEKCDGETEIISIKSCQNVVKNNLFKECQGAVVLRHGNYNIIANNVFLGNNKKGTGGVRVINKGHLIVNNFFYKCKGEDFRSPLSIMNGVPNSPANRYVGVSDAVIANNSFYDCTPISFCEGKSEERSLQPKNVQFLNNLFYNKTDSTFYHIYDDMSGIHVANNIVSKGYKNNFIKGFIGTEISIEKMNEVIIPKPISNLNLKISDSIQNLITSKTGMSLSTIVGYDARFNFNTVVKNAYNNCGANWFVYNTENKFSVNVNCKSVDEINTAIEKYKNNNLTIHLTGTQYLFTKNIPLQENVIFTNDANNPVGIKYLKSTNVLNAVFEIKGNYSVQFQNVLLDATGLQAKVFVTSDSSGTCNHSNFAFKNSSLNNLKCTLLKTVKSSLLDSIVVSNSKLINGQGLLFDLYDEDDRKGYYNVENMKIVHNTISNHDGPLLAVLRSGKDESTMGPWIEITNNNFTNNHSSLKPLLLLNGVQHSFIKNNNFVNCNQGLTFIEYKDEVRAAHILSNNKLENSGLIIKNEFVENK
jgi:poly(beta-D-mannuronate) lyase